MIDSMHSSKDTDSSFTRAADRKSHYYSLLYSEMAERRRAEDHLRRSNLLLQALSHAQLQFMGGADLSEIFAALLQTLLEVTGAQRGYLIEFKEAKESGPPDSLHMHAGAAPNQAERAYITRLANYMLETGHSLIVHPANPHNVQELLGGSSTDFYLGMPIAIERTVANLPIDTSQEADNPVGAIILCGAADDYNSTIADVMRPAVVTSAQLIVTHRNDLRRLEAEQALADQRAQLAQRVAERTAELSYSNAELARAMRAKDEFLATMNHELRTPLNAVLLYAESLRLQLPGPLNAQQMRAAVGIGESANHLLLLINDILDVAKMDAGKLDMDIKPTSVENLCQGAIRLVTEQATKKQIDIYFDRVDEVEQIDADERRLKQMLVNLLSNAVKFTPNNGKVGIEVTSDAASNSVSFTIWDTGIGIKREDLSKLFQPFVQIDSGHERQHGGTGLGLFLVYRMAEIHGGSISVDSEIGQGSRFTITLPWHQSRPAVNLKSLLSESTEYQNPQGSVAASPINVPSSTATASHTSRDPVENHAQLPPPQAVRIRETARQVKSDAIVLIADDNESNVRVLSDFLSGWDCQVYISRTGLQAVQQTAEVHPHLVLMDIQMPEMNGLDAIRTIRSNPTVARTPIVAVTALAMPGDREQCLAAGADDYISKPIHLDRLTEVLNRYLLRVPMEELQ